MWIVGYNQYGKTHFNEFKTEEEAKACYKEDLQHYKDSDCNITIFIAEVKHSTILEV